MITLTKAIALLGKRVWVVYVPHKLYGEVRRGNLCHVTIHSEKLNRGEWHAYVATKSSGLDYADADIFLKKEDAETEMHRRLKDGDET